MYIHRLLVQPTDKNYLNGMWGKLACEILTQNWEAALDELKRLQMFIDESTFGSSLQSLQQKTWLIHWSLFVFFNHPKVGSLDYVVPSIRTISVVFFLHVFKSSFCFDC